MTTMTNQEAADAIRAHHTEMQGELGSRIDALLEAVRSGGASEAVRAAVLDYLDGDLLPHAAAEEEALYPAGDTGLAALLVRAMREEHRFIIGAVQRLRQADDPVTAAATASAVLALFEAHLWKENELLVPTLVADPQVELAQLLAGMHELVG
ncbi:MAG TPA: hemerythrin domain-containing protein [Candidatus Limnocylindria bacterium]|nr:hemerythrin domain-containing protein [Candidatus Limnocylindria bacterium]